METLRAVEGRVFDSRFPWAEIDAEVARSDTAVLDLVREACLIESYFGTYTGKLMELFWYDVDATSVLAIEAFEAYSHFYILRRYLEMVGHRPVTDEEVRELRERDRDQQHTDELEELVNFMMTEHFAAQFFSDLAERAPERVLGDILRRLTREEVSHSALAADLIRKRLDADPALKPVVLEHARNFRHIGAYVLPSVSNVKENNIEAILRMDRQIRELTGSGLGSAPGSLQEE
jgi:hypothetical protein